MRHILLARAGTNVDLDVDVIAPVIVAALVNGNDPVILIAPVDSG